jgi:hypothetical protein
MCEAPWGSMNVKKKKKARESHRPTRPKSDRVAILKMSPRFRGSQVTSHESEGEGITDQGNVREYRLDRDFIMGRFQKKPFKTTLSMKKIPFGICIVVLKLILKSKPQNNKHQRPDLENRPVVTAFCRYRKISTRCAFAQAGVVG